MPFFSKKLYVYNWLCPREVRLPDFFRNKSFKKTNRNSTCALYGRVFVLGTWTEWREGGGVQPANPLLIGHTEQCVQCGSSVQVSEMLCNIGVPSIISQKTRTEWREGGGTAGKPSFDWSHRAVCSMWVLCSSVMVLFRKIVVAGETCFITVTWFFIFPSP